MLNRVFFLIALMIIMLSGAGCLTIPDGEAPADEIIKIESDKKIFADKKDSYEYLATSLMSCLFTLNLNNILVDCDCNSLEICRKVAPMLNLQLVNKENSNYSLSAIENDNGEFEAVLLDKASNKILWRDCVKIDKN